jgi:hypothetical protein
MVHYSTLGNNLKRDLLGFCRKISIGFAKPTQKFMADMIFGIIASNSCKLTEIARSLKEDISIKKLVDRLGRNLSGFNEAETMMRNYVDAAKQALGPDTLLLIDAGDVTKPCSPKMEAIGSVRDGSTGAFGTGYWTMGAVALSDENSQPIPVYESLYPCKKNGGLGSSAETAKCLQSLRENFDGSITRVFDRGFDSSNIILDLIGNDEKFILRVGQNRAVIHNGKRSYIKDVAQGLVCENEIVLNNGVGGKSKCKIGMTKVVVPKMNNVKLNLIVCKVPGDYPFMLYTNISSDLESIAVSIVKTYLMRWRIDEFYAFKKQGLGFEDFRVRSLIAIKNLNLLLTIACGFIGMIGEKAESITVVELIAVSKRIAKPKDFLEKTKLFLYAVLDGITRIFASFRCSLSSYFAPKPRDFQFCLPGFEKMG